MPSAPSEESFVFIDTPPAKSPTPAPKDYGVKTTNVCAQQPEILPTAQLTLEQYPAIKNAPLPADGAGNDSFSNTFLISLLVGVPLYFTYRVGGGFKTFVFFFLITMLPILAAFWLFASSMSPRKNEKATFPGLPVEHYLTFRKEADKVKYRGRNKIPMETFHEMYFNGMSSSMEMRSRLWSTDMIGPPSASRGVCTGSSSAGSYPRCSCILALKVCSVPVYSVLTRADEVRRRTTARRRWRSCRTTNLGIVCEKIGLRRGERMLDIGCGWGTLARYASTHYGAHVTGITLGRNQTAWGNSGLRRDGVPESQSEILCMDYRDIPVPAGGYKRITCLEMAEHVGVRHFSSFLSQVYNMLDDDGVFFLQYAGLRKSWQYEDLVWGLFMNKYIFPGADASTPLGWVVDKLEGAGFEVQSVDACGVHYSATIWRWYRNWMGNREKVEAKYGKRWFRIWEYFLAYSTIIPRQGSANVFQIRLVKNLNSVHRVEQVPTQFALTAALATSKISLAASKASGLAKGVANAVTGTLNA
ncbi:hypothetical protein MRB53_037903 [Persea americana]|nr:hypothetical protein MRB53_037903 [Persea americana]